MKTHFSFAALKTLFLWQFDYKVFSNRSLWINPNWNFLSFMNLCICFLLQIWEVSVITSSNRLSAPFSPHLQLSQCIVKL